MDLAADNEYQWSHALWDVRDPPHEFAPLLERLVQFFCGLSEGEFWRWFKAAAFMIEGKAGRTELDIRVTNLFVLLEIFDGSKSLAAEVLSKLLRISVTDGQLIRVTRNLLVHGPHTLPDALHEATTELRRYQPTAAFTAFLDPPTPSNFYLRLCERINRMIAREVQWSGALNTYSNNLADMGP